LPVMALQERIETELESNPVLELQYPTVDSDEPRPPAEEQVARGERDMVVDEDNGNSEDFERLAEFQDEFGAEFITSDAPARPKPTPGERDRKMDAMANAPAQGISLTEYLLEQWRFVEVAEPIGQAGELIINFIDADGYLRTDLGELQMQTPDPLGMETLLAALSLVQTLDPIGVGARDLQECLKIQLMVEQSAGHDVSVELQLVSHFLRDIEMNRLPDIARKTGKSIDQIKQAIDNISHLDPRPGSAIGQRPVPVIVPDVVVDVEDDGSLTVYAPEGDLPRLHISKSYRKMAADRSIDRKAKDFIRGNLRSAEWVMGAIEQRTHTICRVAEEVFAVQRGFLDSGVEALKPLPMADVAAKVGVHVATVSRAASGKYVQTPRGIFPLRMFFSGGTRTESGQAMSWSAVKVALKEIIDGEDKAKPLNDDQLAASLKACGIDIARRTVAKYRKVMDIPSARKRIVY